MRLLAGKLTAPLEMNSSVKLSGKPVLTVSPPQVSLQYSSQFALQVLATRRK